MKKLFFIFLFIASGLFAQNEDGYFQKSHWTLISATTLESIYDVTIGVAAPDDVQRIFKIIGDADSDAGGDVAETFQITLTPNATPTSATWDFTSTQSAGYRFDDDVTVGVANAPFNIFVAETRAFFGYSGSHAHIGGGSAKNLLLKAGGTSAANTVLTLETDGDVIQGVAAPDDVQPTFSIIGDADSDAGGDVAETIALTLTPVFAR